MKKKFIYCYLLALGLSYPCTTQAQRNTHIQPINDSFPQWTRKIDTALIQFLGKPLLTVLSQSDSVYVYLIDPADTAKNKPTFQGYNIVQNGWKISSRRQEALTSLVTTTDNYSLDNIVKNCVFKPGVAFEFFYRQQRAQLLLCFECDEWEFHYQQQTKHEDCDLIRMPLIALCKRLFPRDRVIQKLKF